METKMNRHEALKFIRENSRCTKSVLLNPVDKSYKWDGYQEIYLEHRIGNNGNVFIVYDAGKDGWDIYFNDGTNSIEKSIEHFKERTFRKEELV